MLQHQQLAGQGLVPQGQQPAAASVPSTHISRSALDADASSRTMHSLAMVWLSAQLEDEDANQLHGSDALNVVQTTVTGEPCGSTHELAISMIPRLQAWMYS